MKGERSGERVRAGRVDDSRPSGKKDQRDASVGSSACERESPAETAISEGGETPKVSSGIGRQVHAGYGGRKRVQRGWIKERLRNSDGRKIWTGYWNAYENVDGVTKKRRKEKVLGLCAKLSKGDAKKKLEDEVIPQYFASLPGAPRQAPETRRIPTFKEAAETYLNLRALSWSRATYKNLTSIFNTHIIPRLGKYKDRRGQEHDYLVTEITASQVQVFFNSGSGGSQSMVKKFVTHTRAVFDICIDDDVLTKNPARAKSVRRPKTRRPESTFLDMTQIQALIATSLKWSYRDYMIVRVLLTCGLRPSELFALKVEDVTNGHLRIDEAVVLGDLHEDTKTKASSAPVPLPPVLQFQLQEYLRQEGIEHQPTAFLFPSEVGTPLSTHNYLRRQLKPMGIDAGIGRVTFQILRRTTATHFQNYGEIKDTQALLRHADSATTLNFYQKTITQNLVVASTKWDHALCPSGGTIQ